MSEVDELRELVLEAGGGAEITDEKIDRFSKLICKWFFRNYESMWFEPPDNNEDKVISVDEDEFLKIIEM